MRAAMTFLARSAVVLSLVWVPSVGAAGVAGAEIYDGGDADTTEVAPDLPTQPEPQQEPDPLPEPQEPPGAQPEPQDPDEPAPQEAPAPQEPGEPEPAPPTQEPSAQTPADHGSTTNAPAEPGDTAAATATPPVTDASDDDEPVPVTPSVSEQPGDDPGRDVYDDWPPSVVDPQPATTTEISEIHTYVDSYVSTQTTTITQWNASWVQYDQYYRPVLVNPYREPLRVVYVYDGAPVVVYVAPRSRVVVQAPTPGFYSFTALVPGAGGDPTKVSVGTFTGGGHQPKPGQPPPPKPPTPSIIKNVTVRFDLGATTYKPIVVASAVDVGDDPEVGLHELLLDGDVPVWGGWSTSATGARIFVATKTLRLPGLERPGQSLPPSYQLTAAKTAGTAATANVSDATGPSTGQIVAISLGAVGVAAAAAAGVIGVRRRRRANPPNDAVHP